MSKFAVLFGTSLFGLVSLVGHAALAGTPITVQYDQTQMIALNADPGTVVVGNPAIADVSVNGKQVFLHGRSAGATNLIILDASGNQVANFDISVTHDNANEVVLISSSPQFPTIHRDTLLCAPNCYREMIPDDDRFGTLISNNQTKSGFALGSKSTDVAPPQAQ